MQFLGEGMEGEAWQDSKVPFVHQGVSTQMPYFSLLIIYA